MSRKTKNHLIDKKPEVPPPAFTVYGISWTEFERGWGCRPDGWSLHKSEEDVSKYLENYRKSLPKSAPDEYSTSDSEKGKLIIVSESLYRKVHQSGSMRMWQNNPEVFKTLELPKE